MGNVAKKFSGMRQVKDPAAPNNEAMEVTGKAGTQCSADHVNDLSKLSAVSLEKKYRKDRNEEAAGQFLKKNVKSIISRKKGRGMKRRSI